MLSGISCLMTLDSSKTQAETMGAFWKNIKCKKKKKGQKGQSCEDVSSGFDKRRTHASVRHRSSMGRSNMPPHFLLACRLTFNCWANNDYWFLPTIFAHDWHFGHTWAATGLPSEQEISVLFQQWQGGVLLQSTINQAVSASDPSITRSWSRFDLHLSLY